MRLSKPNVIRQKRAKIAASKRNLTSMFEEARAKQQQLDALISSTGRVVWDQVQSRVSNQNWLTSKLASPPPVPNEAMRRLKDQVVDLDEALQRLLTAPWRVAADIDSEIALLQSLIPSHLQRHTEELLPSLHISGAALPVYAALRPDEIPTVDSVRDEFLFNDELSGSCEIIFPFVGDLHWSISDLKSRLGDLLAFEPGAPLSCYLRGLRSIELFSAEVNSMRQWNKACQQGGGPLGIRWPWIDGVWWVQTNLYERVIISLFARIDENVASGSISHGKIDIGLIDWIESHIVRQDRDGPYGLTYRASYLQGIASVLNDLQFLEDYLESDAAD